MKIVGDTMNFFASNLVYHRKQSYLTGEKIAKAMDVSRTTYWKWEKGHSEPNKKQVRLLAKLLEISVSDISDLPSIDKPIGAEALELSGSVESWLSFLNIEENKNFRTIITKTFKDTLKLSDKLNEAGVVIKALLSGLNSIFYIKNGDLNYITASDLFLNNLSLSRKYKVYGKTDNDFFSKKEAKYNADKDEKVLLTKEKTVEEGFIPGSRNKKWGIITRMPIFDLNDNVKGIITNMVDITERKKIELKHELLRNCIESIDVGVTIREYKNEKFVFVNKALSKITEYPLEEIYDEGLSLLSKNCYVPDNDDKTEELRRDWHNRPKHNEYMLKCKDNSEKWIEDIHSSAVSFMKKKYAISLVTDITKRKEQEKSRELLKIYLEESPLGIIIIEEEKNKALYLNKAVLAIYEPIVTLEEIYQMSRSDFIEIYNHPDDREREYEYLKNKNWPSKRELRIITPEAKKLKWVEIVISKRRILGKECNISVISDITARKQNQNVIEVLKRNNVSQKVIKEVMDIQ